MLQQRRRADRSPSPDDDMGWFGHTVTALLALTTCLAVIVSVSVTSAWALVPVLLGTLALWVWLTTGLRADCDPDEARASANDLDLPTDRLH